MGWLMNRHRPSKPKSPFHLDLPLVLVEGNEAITIRDSFTNTVILGSPGSGKTTTSGYLLAKAMLARGYAALAMTAKPDEASRFTRLAREVGREAELVIFDESRQFNFLKYIASLNPTDTSFSNVLIGVIEEISELLDRLSGKSGDDSEGPFWTQSRRLYMLNAIDLCLLAIGEVSLPNLAEIMNDSPRSLEQARNAEWQRQSIICQLLSLARNKATTEYQLEDIAAVETYFLRTFAGLAEKTRSIIEASVYGVVQLFSRGMLKKMFCTDTTDSPEDLLDGKIIVLNLPIKKYFGIGMVAQTLFKIAAQMRLEQRQPHEIRPCMFYMDECQSYLTLRDQAVAATARSSRIANVWLTQCVSNLHVSLGGHEAGKATVESLLGLASIKIFHANGDPVTNNWAADLIGRRRIRMRSVSLVHEPTMNFSLFRPPPQVTSSSSESFEFIVPPHTFAMLQQPSSTLRKAEAIVFQAGRRFASTGEPYCQTYFEQGY